MIPPTDAYRIAAETTAIVQGSSGAFLETAAPRRSRSSSHGSWPEAPIVLDDLDRPGEREVLARWEAQTPWRFRVDEAAGAAVGARG